MLLEDHPKGTVALAKWLNRNGISFELQQHYRKIGLLQIVGSGAFKIAGDELNWQGGIYTLQEQAKLLLYPGSTTSLALQGLLPPTLSANDVYLFSPLNTFLPRWFSAHLWGRPIHHIRTSLFAPHIGMVPHHSNGLTIQISGPERAMMECLNMSPKRIGLIECYKIMEGLTDLYPGLVQSLLEKCPSMKVKRYFLNMAQQAQHPWLTFIEAKKIDLGSEYCITSNRIYNRSSKRKTLVAQELPINI